VIVVTGAGERAFSAGADILEFVTPQVPVKFRDARRRVDFRAAMDRCGQPIIAAINGFALGGGLELALACDLRVARRGVMLGLTESRLAGLAGNGSLRLARLVGPARAKELLFAGETITAEIALAWGLVNRVNDASALEAARELATTIASRGPLSNRLAKELVDAAHDGPLDAALTRSTVAQQRIFDSDDLHEGVAAFFEKRDPAFKGR